MNNTLPVVPTRPGMLRFTLRDQAVFAKRLSMILRSGVPVCDGLVMLDTGHNSRSATYIIQNLIRDVSRGATLSAGLASFATIFGAFSINIIRVGESAGTLHQNLEYLSEELKKKDALKKKIIGALIYPLIIAIATIGISLVLTMYIFPKIMPIFQSFKQELPVTTRALIALSQFLIKDGVWVVLGLAAFCSIFVWAMRFQSVRFVTDRTILHLPLFGRLSRYYNLATFSRTMSLLLRGDVAIVQALEIVVTSTRNSIYQEHLQRMARAVMHGQRMSTVMQRDHHLFPSLVTQMVIVGETTGNLAGSLMYVSDMYEEEINDLTKNMSVLLEPVLMIVMGLIVGFIAISIITPIYGITQNLTPH